jgi:hypothetical protein
LSQAPNNIICNESSIKTKDMGRGEKPAFNTKHRERQSSASHTRYRKRDFSMPYKI